jgi:hypothetical protein
VTGGRAQAGVDWVEAARSRCAGQAVEGLWARVPQPMRLSYFAESSVPAQYAGAFCHDGTWRAGVDLSILPQPMRREVAWCVFRIIELGGKIATPGLSMLVRRLGEVLADRGGQAPVSLLGLSGRDWCQQIQHAVHRRTGRCQRSSNSPLEALAAHDLPQSTFMDVNMGTASDQRHGTSSGPPPSTGRSSWARRAAAPASGRLALGYRRTVVVRPWKPVLRVDTGGHRVHASCPSYG